ncbi:bifunctional metallophosphatase/5'-nucleotidase [Flavobacterium columnare]|uniref:Bifunctional metallophosphatase/5'-nucleotidase n=1 Tax=Flavobacterium columnare TaxID=996 RepID=A0AAI8GAZ7_9FLAO|nr:metallophosphatase [Flavobacterium columnare]AMO19945.1 bifunctional metallophosphatase/5'-nucleotidase [Flavobacterium columnare]AUX17887.1 metallophosphatase [Flavobacterium columnare]QOG56954.1 metallophosphoesterase [Flavobacterium columnare]QOG59678.1 metallophosphoesterase [Flavobacterium columnare]QOG62398.1 metallophosphoesterase [Flavobacterium columnare]
MKRRDFLKNTVASSALLGLGGLSLSSFNTAGSSRKLTILHTNDTHSQIDPFPEGHPKNPNLGGVARRAALISQIRKEEDNVLLLDAGDIFQGTPYFNYYGGEIEFKVMSMMKYDLATIGNHDFDNGITGLYGQLPNASFEFVCANYDFKNTILDTHIKPYKIFEKAGIKIGIFGLGVELYGLVDPRYYKETKYLDPVEIANDITKKLKEVEKCDLIICLSHLGFEYKNEPERISDINLAKKTKNIDLIIGGHTHTFLDKPVIERNLDDKEVLINQVGAYGINLGRIDFYIDDQKNIAPGTGRKIVI